MVWTEQYLQLILFKMFLNALRKEAQVMAQQYLRQSFSLAPPSLKHPAISSWVAQTWHCRSGGGGRAGALATSLKHKYYWVKLLKFWKFLFEIRHLCNEVNENKMTAFVLGMPANNMSIHWSLACSDCRRMVPKRLKHSNFQQLQKQRWHVTFSCTRIIHFIWKHNLFFSFYMWWNQC